MLVSVKVVSWKASAPLKKNWDETLPMLLFACRDLHSEATGFSPFELLYGKSTCTAH